MQPQRQTPSIPSGTELPRPVENLPVAREVPRTINAVPGIEGPTVAPAPEAAQVTPIEKGHSSAPEKKTARTINNQPVAQPQQQQPDPNPQILQQVDPSAQSQAVFDPSASGQGAGPSVADDNDVIEKEWVNKAKQVVNETRDNPYEQEKQVSRLQADYLKKRYGKDVKVPKD